MASRIRGASSSTRLAAVHISILLDGSEPIMRRATKMPSTQYTLRVVLARGAAYNSSFLQIHQPYSAGNHSWHSAAAEQWIHNGWKRFLDRRPNTVKKLRQGNLRAPALVLKLNSSRRSSKTRKGIILFFYSYFFCILGFRRWCACLQIRRPFLAFTSPCRFGVPR
jgi:hypothetical protein